MELTREETIKALEQCDKNSCDGCPLSGNDDRCFYIVQENALRWLKENEPAPSANDTSSEKENTLHLDDSTSKQICQALDKVDRAVTTIISDIYDNMTVPEQRAFDLGEIYRDMLSAKCELEGLKGGDGNAN